MNKKLLSIISIFTLIAFVGINVKADDVDCGSSTYQSYGGSNSCSKKDTTSDDDAETYCVSYSNCNTTYCNKTSQYKNGCKTGASSQGCVENSSTHACECGTPSFTLDGPNDTTISGNSDQTRTASIHDDSTLTLTACSSNNSTVASVTNAGAITIHPTAVDSKTCIESVTITCTAKNACGNTSTATLQFNVHRTDWSDKDTHKQVASDRQDTCRETAENNHRSICYKNCKTVEVNGKKIRYCDTENRGCGTPEVDPDPACYEDSRGFLWWDDTGKSTAPNGQKFQTYNQTTGNWDVNNAYKRRDDIKDSSSCYVQFRCSEKYPQTNKVVETTCNGTHSPSSTPTNDNNGELTGVYTRRCGLYDVTKGVIGNQFYEITCEETMYTSFEGPIFNDSSKPKSFVYPGTAFSFEYKAKSKIKCGGSWDQNFYNDAHYYAEKHLNSYKDTVSSDVSETGFQWGQKASKEMELIKKGYENWDRLKYLSNPGGTIKDDQPEITEVTKPDEHKFNLELVAEIGEDNKLKPEECGLHSGTSDVNYQAIYTISIKMPVLWYNRNAKYTDEEHNEYSISDCGDGCEKIGRFFPVSLIDSYADRNDYVYNVNITGLGMSSKWSNNETCQIDMHKKDLYFRSVNINDPFIQNLAGGSHEIGLNWKNDKFDFTGLIKSDVWSKPSQYNMVRIDESQGKLIKTELSSEGLLYYTGLCSRGLGNNSTVCALYNQAKTGH